jgi:hypothetical protein
MINLWTMITKIYISVKCTYPTFQQNVGTDVKQPKQILAQETNDCPGQNSRILAQGNGV